MSKNAREEHREEEPRPELGQTDEGLAAGEASGEEGAETEGGIAEGGGAKANEAVSVPREEWDALRKKAAEYDALEDKFKRAAAEYANSQKRLDREAATRIEYAVQEFAREILPVTDSLHRALLAAEQSGDIEAFIQGIRLVDKQFADILARHGIVPIEAPLGETFDPEVHDVLAVVPTDEHPENAVAEVVERGFRIKGRVLRPAKVIVAKSPGEGDKQGR